MIEKVMFRDLTLRSNKFDKLKIKQNFFSLRLHNTQNYVTHTTFSKKIDKK